MKSGRLAQQLRDLYMMLFSNAWETDTACPLFPFFHLESGAEATASAAK